MFVIRKKLEETEGAPPSTRYDPDCDCVQTTIDGGATWTDTPSQDPRTSPAFQLPDTAEQCAAAQGVANFVREFVDGTYEAFNIVGVSSWALNIGLLAFPQIAIFYKIALIVADAIVAIGSLTLSETFTEPLYDEMRDIAFCFLDAGGKFANQSKFDDFGAAIQDDISDSNVNIVMAAMFNLYGFVGFNNASVRLAESSDCSGADCSCTAIFDFLDNDGGFVSNDYGQPSYSAWQWTSGIGWVQASGGASQAWLTSITYPPDITITEIRITVIISGTTVANPLVFGTSTPHVFSTGSGEFPFPGGTSDLVNNYMEFVSSHSGAASYTITRLEVDWDNCE